MPSEGEYVPEIVLHERKGDSSVDSRHVGLDLRECSLD